MNRLSIALEILVRPRLLFLDEPTSGLDSASAFFVIQALKSVARDGRSVISSIHQPSSEVHRLWLSTLAAVYTGRGLLWVKGIGDRVKMERRSLPLTLLLLFRKQGFSIACCSAAAVQIRPCRRLLKDRRSLPLTMLRSRIQFSRDMPLLVRRIDEALSSNASDVYAKKEKRE